MVGLSVPLNSKLPLCLHSAISCDFRSQVRTGHKGEVAPPIPQRTGKGFSERSRQPYTAAEVSPGPAAPPGCLVSEPQAGVCLQRRGDEALCGLSQGQGLEGETDPEDTRLLVVPTFRMVAHKPSSPLRQKDRKAHRKPQKTFATP